MMEGRGCGWYDPVDVETWWILMVCFHELAVVSGKEEEEKAITGCK